MQIRYLQPTSWLAIELTEGRNRQVRRMTAKVGFPTLRLIRVRIGTLDLGSLLPGQWRPVQPGELGISADIAGPRPAGPRRPSEARRQPAAANRPARR